MKQKNKYYLIFFAHPVVQKFPFVVKREGKTAISILPADDHYSRSTSIKMVIFIVWVWILPHEHDRRELELALCVIFMILFSLENVKKCVLGGCMITSKTKINIVWNFFSLCWGTTPFEKISNNVDFSLTLRN